MRDSWQEKTYPSLSTIAQAITGRRSRTRFPVSIARARRPESNLSIKIITVVEAWSLCRRSPPAGSRDASCLPAHGLDRARLPASRALYGMVA